jgi:uncharacterized protein YbaR (Trm112 family)
LSKSYLDILRCPHCAKNGKGILEQRSDQFLACLEPDCKREYPIIDGFPVMLTEAGDFLGYRKKILKMFDAENSDG